MVLSLLAQTLPSSHLKSFLDFVQHSLTWFIIEWLNLQLFIKITLKVIAFLINLISSTIIDHHIIVIVSVIDLHTIVIVFVVTNLHTITIASITTASITGPYINTTASITTTIGSHLTNPSNYC